MARPKGTKNPDGHKAGRPAGPKKINLGTVRVLPATAKALKSAKLTAAQALDSLKWR